MRLEKGEGAPWRPSGLDSAFPLQDAQVQSLIRELRSPKPHGAAKKKKKKKEGEMAFLVTSQIPKRKLWDG